MQEIQVRDIAPQERRRAGKLGIRLAAAGVTLAGVLGAASPAWAGPLMGC